MRGRRLFGCLVKAPLGCLAFFAGAIVVFVLFLPAAGGRVLPRLAEKRFAEEHHGRVEINEVWFPSFYGPQRIESLSLRDQANDEILHARLLAPALGPYGSSDGVWGPIEIHVEKLEIVEDEEGVTNLARALEWRDPEREHPELGIQTSRNGIRFGAEGFSFEVGDRVITLSLSIDRVDWSDAEGHEFQLLGLTSSGRIAVERGRIGFELSGRSRVGANPEEGFQFRWTVDDLEALGAPERGLSWSFEGDVTQAPLAFLEALFSGARKLEPALGDSLEHLRFIYHDDGSGPPLFEGSVESAGTRIVATSSLDADSMQLLGSEEDRVKAEFPADSWWTRSVLPEFLPLAEALEVVSSSKPAALELADFALPTDGSWPGFRARVAFSADELSFELAKRAAEELRVKSDRRRQPLPLELSIEEGRVRFQEFALAAELGEIVCEGAYDLATRSYAPVILVLSPNLGGRSFELSGPREDPELVPLED